MTTFSDIFKGNPVTDLNSMFGESVTYYVAGGSNKSITARIMRENIRPDYGQDGKRNIKQARVIVLRDSTTGIASPAIGDYINFDSLNWDVVEIEAQDGAESVLVVQRVDTIEKSKQGHRLS